ncbi:MAG TPA: methylmalonyl-CoA mutase subunit beta, partial [Kaistiaceae bacterium]|nr:methylmalonyl-CoA mutase subunit beta [Kaistiaceae bacterium]
MAEQDLSLSEIFPAQTEDDWRRLVEKSLAGAPFEKKLVSRTRDGIALSPLYSQREAGLFVAGRPAAEPWRVIQRVDLPDLAAANAQVLTDLEGGATGLEIVLPGVPAAHGGGVPLADADAFAKALAGVALEAISLRVDAGSASAGLGRILLAEAAANGVAAADLDVAFVDDPLARLAATGAGDVSADLAAAAALAGEFAAKGVKGRVLSADGRVWHAAGASEAQELAAAAAAIVAFLRAFEAAGIAPEAALARIGVTLAADAEQFATIAKFRAMRLLWNRIAEGCGVGPVPLALHAETAWRMMTRRDVYVNSLRTTIACFAAGIGGADSVTVLPFTAPLGLADGFARRLARNTQTVLIEESSLARVADPAAGSGYVESLTHELAAAAWGLFQGIEAEGGLLAALKSGSLKAAIDKVKAARLSAVATRREPITGTSEFPDLAEARVEVLDMAVPAAFAGLGAGSGPDEVAALAPHRVAESFEALRERADAAAAKGAAPGVFLATLGPVAAFTARVTFARNFFAAGGFASAGGVEYADADALVAAFRDSGAQLACICSSDVVYAEKAADAARALKAAGAGQVYLAGRPGDLEAALGAAGVGSYVFVGA